MSNREPLMLEESLSELLSELTPEMAEKLRSLCVFVDAEIDALQQASDVIPENAESVKEFRTEVQEARDWIERLLERVVARA